MKQKPYPFKVLLHALSAVACLCVLIGPGPAQATTLPTVPTTPLACPIPDASAILGCTTCCSNPDKVLKDMYRGNGYNGTKSLNDWYSQDYILLLQGKFRSMTRFITSAITTETTSIGTFLDAQNNMRAAGSLMQRRAQAAQEMAPSEALCRYGTLALGLGASEANSDAIKQEMIQRSMARQLLKEGQASAEDRDATTTNTGGATSDDAPRTRGQSSDKIYRWQLFATKFCNPAEDGHGNGTGQDQVCNIVNDAQLNADVNYARTIEDPLSLNFGLDAGNTVDAQNITGLADNLYGHDIINNAPNSENLDPTVPGNLNNIKKYLLMRSAIARRSVAENSFAAVTAMKSKGSDASAKYVKLLMQELGLKKEEADLMVGANPSYYAQMEALSRKLYQSPTFYINLMEGPANVQRQQASMKAIELMQQRDMYKSMQRSEMLLATLLEIYADRKQSGLDKGVTKGSE